MVCVVMAPRLLRLADWGTTLQKLVVCATWAASIVLAVQLQTWPSPAVLTRRQFPSCVVLGVAAATIGARQLGAAPECRHASAGHRAGD